MKYRCQGRRKSGPQFVSRRRVRFGESRFRCLAFTLVEILVVIAIISVLASLLLPTLGRALEAARTTRCLSQTKQFGTGTDMYSGEWNGYMPIAALAAGHSMEWRYEIAPYLGLNPVDVFDSCLRKGVFRCPSFGSATDWSSGYGWNKEFFGYYDNAAGRSRCKLAAVTRPSESAVCGDGTDWYNTGVWDMDYLLSPIFVGGVVPAVGNRHGGDLASRSGGGINILWADLHAQWKTQAELLRGIDGDLAYFYRNRR